MPWKSLGPWRFVYVWFNTMPVTEQPLTGTFGMIAMVVPSRGKKAWTGFSVHSQHL